VDDSISPYNDSTSKRWQRAPPISLSDCSSRLSGAPKHNAQHKHRQRDINKKIQRQDACSTNQPQDWTSAEVIPVKPDHVPIACAAAHC